MIGKKQLQAKLLYNINLEELVPEDNFYRVLEKILDLNFIYKKCESLYGKTGNKSIDPVVFFKANLFGFFEDIVSDRELIRRMSDSLAARLYLGYDIDEELPWHSTISRTRVLMPEKLFEEIFNRVLKMCADTGLIEGSHQSIDSTLVKANASLEKVERKSPKLTIEKYIEETKKGNPVDSFGQITESVTKIEENIEKNEELTKGKNQFTLIKSTENKRKSLSNVNYKSRTDPDSRIAKKPGKPVDLYYSVHYAVDSRARIITDVLSSYADKSDSSTLMEIVNRTEGRLNDLGLTIESVGADKNYCSGENLRELEQKAIQPYIPTQKHPNTTGGIDKKEFTYDESKDQYICPAGKGLKYKYTTKKKAKVYCVENKECLSCLLREKCTKGKKLRRIQHSIFIKEYERLSERMKGHNGKQKMRIRKTTTEPLFAEAKSNHGLSKFMTIGLGNSQKKAFCIATVQNLKRLVKHLRRKANDSILFIRDADSHIRKQISHFKEFFDFINLKYFFQPIILHEKI
jgi:transposase